MNRKHYFFASLLVCFISTACQSTTNTAGARDAKKTTSAKPTLPQALPAWTNSKAKRGGSNRFIHLTTKVIEISQVGEMAAAPATPYRKRLNDRELQKYVRVLSQKKGVDLMTAPSVVARDGEGVKTEVIREFVYPSGPEPGSKMAKENVGVTNYHRARLSPDGKSIRLDTLTDVSEFEGFSTVSPELEQPVFNRRRAQASIDLADGESVVIGGLKTQDKQEVEDYNALGFLTKRETIPFTRELIVIVTATRQQSTLSVSPPGERRKAPL